jgi:uncharacterized protein
VTPRALPPPPSLAPRVGFKADVNICSVDGSWPGCAAAAAGRALIVSNLVAHGAHVNICDRSGVSISPVLAAAFSKNLECVDLRVVAGASSNSLFVALHEACEIGDRQAVEALFADGADINQCNRTGESPFQVAVARGHFDAVAALLHAGAGLRMAAFAIQSLCLGQERGRA